MHQGLASIAIVGVAIAIFRRWNLKEKKPQTNSPKILDVEVRTNPQELELKEQKKENLENAMSPSSDETVKVTKVTELEISPKNNSEHLSTAELEFNEFHLPYSNLVMNNKIGEGVTLFL